MARVAGRRVARACAYPSLDEGCNQRSSSEVIIRGHQRVRTLALVSSITMASREGKLACGEEVEGAVVSTCMQGCPWREGRAGSPPRACRAASGFVRDRQGSSGRAPIELPLALKSFVRRGAKPLSAHTDGTSGRSYVPAAGRRSARRFRVEDAREGRVVLFAHPAREVDLVPVGKDEAPW